ncbi:MAG TPA: hypothetical protein VGQ49_08265 [Bryobacteraceae bacterium]|nr:hypothetical protein [Bryobacteraceae bacterium]
MRSQNESEITIPQTVTARSVTQILREQSKGVWLTMDVDAFHRP